MAYFIIDNDFLDIIRNGDKANLTSFLKTHSNLISQDAYNEAFEEVTIFNNNIVLAKILLEEGANLISQNLYDQAFNMAVRNNPEFAKFLIEEYISLISQDGYNEAFEEVTIFNNNIVLAKILLEKGANLIFQNLYDQAFDVAARKNPEFAKFLIERHISLISLDVYNKVFEEAARNNPEFAKFLMEEYISLISQDAYNEAFDVAARKNPKFAKFLIENGQNLIYQESYVSLLKHVMGEKYKDYKLPKKNKFMELLSLSLVPDPNEVFKQGNEIMEYLLKTPNIISQDTYYKILSDYVREDNMRLTNFLVNNAPHITPMTYQKLFNYALTVDSKYSSYLKQKTLVDYSYANFHQELLSVKFKCEESHNVLYGQCSTEKKHLNVIKNMLPEINPYSGEVCDYSKLIGLLKQSTMLSDLFYVASLNSLKIYFNELDGPFGKYIRSKNAIELSHTLSFKTYTNLVDSSTNVLTELTIEEVIIHELAHASMKYLFSNNVLPYNNEDELVLYKSAVDKMLDNVINHYVKEDNKPTFRSSFEKGKWIKDKLSFDGDVYGKDCAVHRLLSVYNCYFSSMAEYQEVIVKYPEIIAGSCYEQSPLAKEIFPPIAQYWDEVITPVMALHNEWHEFNM